MPMLLLKTGPIVPGRLPRLELHDVSHSREPYAILSHTWGSLKDEIIYADLARCCDPDIRRDEGYIFVDLESESGASLRRKSGWFKIQASLEQARRDGYQWLWADTACIDKSSSAELSEAINSMYNWYGESSICYAYLADVPSPEETNHSFRDSRWFTRGFTLQELIAPKNVVFYSQGWANIGDKHSLAQAVSEITNIDVQTLQGVRSVSAASVAKRMSWAANRKTSRPEDRAYSLMGLFGINMPMLYGEGAKAFNRLQEEIMKVSDDQSIFAWIDPSIGDRRHGLLADSPSAFAHAYEYRHYRSQEQPSFDMSNRGLSIGFHLTPKENGVYIASLFCPLPSTLDGFLGIYLEKLQTGENQYARIRCGEICFLSVLGRLDRIFVRPSFPKPDAWDNVMSMHILHICNVKSDVTKRPGWYGVLDLCSLPFDREELKALDPRMLDLPRPRIPVDITLTMIREFPGTFKLVKQDRRVVAALLFRFRQGAQQELEDEYFVLLLGSGTAFNVGCDVVSSNTLVSLQEYNELFKPKPIGTPLDVGNHRVTVE